MIENALKMLNSSDNPLLDSKEWIEMHNKLIDDNIKVSVYSYIAKVELEKLLVDIVLKEAKEKARKGREPKLKKEYEEMRKEYKEYISEFCKDGLDEIRKSKNFRGTKAEIKTLLEGMELGVNNIALFPSLHGEEDLFDTLELNYSSTG